MIGRVEKVHRRVEVTNIATDAIQVEFDDVGSKYLKRRELIKVDDKEQRQLL